MAKPNFFIIGAPRCGTTSLASLLSENPSVYFSNPKETRFFSENYHKSIQFYEKKYFRKADHPLVGEGDVSYFTNPKAAERIAKHYPASKLVVLLRNPIQRAFSGYLLGVRAGKFKKPFLETLEANLERVNLFEEGKLKYSDIEWKDRLLQTGHYLENIKTYSKFWPRHKIKIIIFERLMENTKKELEALYDFLGIKSERNFFFPHENIYTSKMYFKIRKKFKFLGKWGFLKPVKKAEKMARKKIFLSNKPTLDPGAREFLCHYYKKRVQDLKDFLNDEIKEWSDFDQPIKKGIDV